MDGESQLFKLGSLCVVGVFLALQTSHVVFADAPDVEVHYIKDIHLADDFDIESLGWREVDPVHLVISHTVVTPSLLRYVASLKSLKSLVIGDGVGGGSETIVPSGAYMHLKNLDTLEVLELVAVEDYLEQGEYSFISSLSKLRDLTIQAKLTEDMIQAFRRHGALSSLDCWSVSGSVNIELLSDIRRLKTLYLGTIDLPDDRFSSFIESLKRSNIRTLSIRRKKPHLVRARDLRELLKVPSLESLTIRYVDQSSLRLLNNADLERLMIGVDGLEAKHRNVLRELKGVANELYIVTSHVGPVFNVLNGKVVFDRFAREKPNGTDMVPEKLPVDSE